MARYFNKLSLFFSLLLKGALDMTGININIARLAVTTDGSTAMSRRIAFQPLFG